MALTSEGPTGVRAGGLDHPTPPPSGPGPDGPLLTPPRRRRAWLGSWRRRLAAGLVIAAALGFLLAEGLSNATVYFKTADQAVADKASLGTRQFRIEGTVQPGVSEVAGTTHFSIFANGVAVAVVASKQPPQLFKAGIPVVLEGHWAGSYFASDLIMVKHSADYVEAHPDRLKSQLPSTPTTQAATTRASP